jgi:hypothetical protein
LTTKSQAVTLQAVLVFMVQCGNSCFGAGHASLLEPLALLGFIVCGGVLVVPLLGLLVSRSRGTRRDWRAKRRRLRAAATAETRARALMGELCPHGWRAQITLLGADEGQVPTAANGEPARVALDWTELQDESGRPAVMRRVWAPTIGEALDAMVADRRTDETLEQIEHGAVADGALWPDP